MNHEQHHENKKKSALSVKKSIGISSKVLGMIEEDKYCPEIIQQIDATIGLLNSAKKTLLKGHLDHCLEDKLKENRQGTLDELIKIFNLS